MKKSNFEERIASSFKTETPDILNKIKSSDQFFVPDKAKKFEFGKFFNKRLSYSLASIFVLALILFSVLSSGTEVNPVIASTVTIDINPSIRITLDEDDNVINVSAINNDGEFLIDQDVIYRGLTLDKSIEIILAKALELDYIVEDTLDNVILIDVEANEATVKARIEQALEEIIGQEMLKIGNGYEIRKENRDDLTEDEVTNLHENAQQFRVSLAKLHLINRIIEVDDSYTIENLKDESVMKLYQILNELIPDLEVTPGNSENPGNN